MRGKTNKEQVKLLMKNWEKLLLSNKLNICTKELEGATVLEVNILKAAYEKPDIILKEITTHFNIPSSTLTSAVNRLQKRDLLKRVISERDLRSFGLLVTDKGKEAIEEHYKQEELVLGAMLEAFDTDEERDKFVKLFGKLVERFI